MQNTRKRTLLAANEAFELKALNIHFLVINLNLLLKIYLL